MSDKDSWIDNVFAERSLWEAFSASIAIDSNKFNVITIRIVAAFMLMYIACNYAFGVNNEQVVAAITRSGQALLTFTTAILGFLVAGFAIFISSTPTRVLKMLVATRYLQTEISVFKLIAFGFLNVFTVFLCSLSYSLFIVLVSPLGNIPLFDNLGKMPIVVIETFNSVILASVVLAGCYSLLRLKSFIWNMYQALLVSMHLS